MRTEPDSSPLPSSVPSAGTAAARLAVATQMSRGMRRVLSITVPLLGVWGCGTAAPLDPDAGPVVDAGDEPGADAGPCGGCPDGEECVVADTRASCQCPERSVRCGGADSCTRMPATVATTRSTESTELQHTGGNEDRAIGLV